MQASMCELICGVSAVTSEKTAPFHGNNYLKANNVANILVYQY